MLEMKCKERLGSLLAKAWDLHRIRELAHHNEVAIRAAQKAVEEPGELFVTVPGFVYRIFFYKNGRMRKDLLAVPDIYPESIPSPEVIQQARDIRKKMLVEIKEIAEEKRQPQICWDGEQVVIESFLARYPPIAMKWLEDFEFGKHWAEQGGMKEQIWEYVARQILQAADPIRLFNAVQLFRYAEQVCEENVVFSDNASFEINRLDSSGFTDRLWGELVKRYPDELREMDLSPNKYTEPLDDPALQNEIPTQKKGVTLEVAALILTDEDTNLVPKMKKRWQNSKSPKLPNSIGPAPEHKQKKLYEPSALSDFVEKNDGKSLCDEHQLRTRLMRKARLPRGK